MRTGRRQYGKLMVVKKKRKRGEYCWGTSHHKVQRRRPHWEVVGKKKARSAKGPKGGGDTGKKNFRALKKTKTLKKGYWAYRNGKRKEKLTVAGEKKRHGKGVWGQGG